MFSQVLFSFDVVSVLWNNYCMHRTMWRQKHSLTCHIMFIMHVRCKAEPPNTNMDHIPLKPALICQPDHRGLRGGSACLSRSPHLSAAERVACNAECVRASGRSPPRSSGSRRVLPGPAAGWWARWPAAGGWSRCRPWSGCPQRPWLRVCGRLCCFCVRLQQLRGGGGGSGICLSVCPVPSSSSSCCSSSSSVWLLPPPPPLPPSPLHISFGPSSPFSPPPSLPPPLPLSILFLLSLIFVSSLTFLPPPSSSHSFYLSSSSSCLFSWWIMRHVEKLCLFVLHISSSSSSSLLSFFSSLLSSCIQFNWNSFISYEC